MSLSVQSRAMIARYLLVIAAALLAQACSVAPPAPAVVAPQPVVPAKPQLKIALVLGGGAARGIAHVGVIKALEAQGIVADIIVGTSAGSVVGALYAGGASGFDLQKQVMQLDEAQFSDWTLPDRGVLKGEALQDFVNRAVGERPLEKLAKLFAVVATDLQAGRAVVFRTGNTGMAVRASSAIPGVFQPVTINGRDYVDGVLVAPVPVRVARSLGATFVIAVDISARPEHGRILSTMDVLLQSFSIMSQELSRHELPEADIVVRPYTPDISSTSFQDKHLAVLEGERAVAAILPELKLKLAKARGGS